MEQHTEKREFKNVREHVICLRLEPWGDECLIVPGSTVEVTATGPPSEIGTLVIEEDEIEIVVYGWPGSTISATCNGEIVASGEIPAPRTPTVHSH